VKQQLVDLGVGEDEAGPGKRFTGPRGVEVGQPAGPFQPLFAVRERDVGVAGLEISPESAGETDFVGAERAECRHRVLAASSPLTENYETSFGSL
jgi:hypothetical protein